MKKRIFKDPNNYKNLSESSKKVVFNLGIDEIEEIIRMKNKKKQIIMLEMNLYNETIFKSITEMHKEKNTSNKVLMNDSISYLKFKLEQMFRKLDLIEKDVKCLENRIMDILNNKK